MEAFLWHHHEFLHVEAVVGERLTYRPGR